MNTNTPKTETDEDELRKQEARAQRQRAEQLFFGDDDLDDEADGDPID